jgi:hypothetical protein
MNSSNGSGAGCTGIVLGVNNGRIAGSFPE